jgi:hypothetical protein
MKDVVLIVIIESSVEDLNPVGHVSVLYSIILPDPDWVGIQKQPKRIEIRNRIRSV